MLYSIGYQDKMIEDFVKALKKYGVSHLLDVRSRPTSRNATYRQSFLSGILHKNGIIYTWAGDRLGGFKAIKERDIRGLAELQEHLTVCVMCMEADPSACHRHLEIGRRIKVYGVEIQHIVSGQVGIKTITL